MKLLLTSAGITNTTIHNALVDLLGKPIAESSALCIPTGCSPSPAAPECSGAVYKAFRSRAPAVDGTHEMRLN